MRQDTNTVLINALCKAQHGYELNDYIAIRVAEHKQLMNDTERERVNKAIAKKDKASFISPKFTDVIAQYLAYEINDDLEVLGNYVPLDYNVSSFLDKMNSDVKYAVSMYIVNKKQSNADVLHAELIKTEENINQDKLLDTIYF